MEITRKINGFEYQITLTSDEMFKAWEEQQRDFDTETIADYLSDLEYGYVPYPIIQNVAKVYRDDLDDGDSRQDALDNAVFTCREELAPFKGGA